MRDTVLGEPGALSGGDGAGSYDQNSALRRSGTMLSFDWMLGADWKLLAGEPSGGWKLLSGELRGVDERQRKATPVPSFCAGIAWPI
ncbi:MAG: hypothetical protein KF752_01600 [Pirellulaceae bacterium]|nr:hypothetical protein [Pirellulaceae bacterium]